MTDRLPLLISVPHGGTDVPTEAAPYCTLTHRQIVEDGDEGAREIYAPLEDHAVHFVTTSVARAVLDMNRAEDDFRKDGILKTHTCWDVPIWDPPLPKAIGEGLIAHHHRAYHARLDELAGEGVVLGVDCHTMAAKGPPVGPDPGVERPLVCLGNGRGTTCPDDVFETFAESFEQSFGIAPALNEPFSGGYIVRAHSKSIPWIQIELSRTPALSNAEKSERVVKALEAWCARR